MPKKTTQKKTYKGFTLIELLVVIAIIGLLATFAVISFSNAREKTRDAKRLSDVRAITKALELYKDQYGNYPADNEAADGCGGWDAGKLGGPNGGDAFIQSLSTSGILSNVPADPQGTTCGTTYLYYRYPAGSYGCDASLGDYYVIGIMNLETSNAPHSQSPGFSCPGRDWSAVSQFVAGLQAEWVEGHFQRIN